LERKNLWAPWRIGYVKGLSDRTSSEKGQSDKAGHSSECFICHNLANPQDDAENMVLWRSDYSLVILNRFPYNNGHLLIAPGRHIAALGQATNDELLELTKLIREAQKALSFAIEPQGFMSVCSDTDVISQSMTELYDQLKRVSKDHNLPRL
jgi:ATP adenylyltransferase